MFFIVTMSYSVVFCIVFIFLYCIHVESGFGPYFDKLILNL